MLTTGYMFLNSECYFCEVHRCMYFIDDSKINEKSNKLYNSSCNKPIE